MSRIDDQVVDALAPGHFVSGAELGRRLGVSRGSVRNAVCRLRDDGLVVHAVHGRGYRLERPIRILDGAAIRARLGARRPLLAERLTLHRRIESTSTWLLARAGHGDLHGHACLAEFQSGGRGRRGRVWQAAPYRHVLLSLAWSLGRGPSAVTGLSLAAGVAARRAIERLGAGGVGLKWPNDLLAGDAKLGGVLVDVIGEAAGHCRVVVGLGVNVESDRALANVTGLRPAAVEELVEGTVDRSLLAADLVLALADALEQFDRAGFAPFRDEWNRAHVWRGRPVQAHGAGRDPLCGVAAGVDDDGALCLRDASGTLHRVIAGDVSLRSG